MVKINKKMKISKEIIGNNKTEIIVVDNILEDITPLIDYALNKANFENVDKSFYPGVRANLPDFYLNIVDEIIQEIDKSTGLLFNFTSIKNEFSAYSVLTKNEKNLRPEQCIPHYDSLDPNFIALTHYLNSGDFGGTAFYRHKLTNIEIVSQDNINDYLDTTNEFVRKNGLFEQKYFSSSTELFELIGVIPYKPNRLVIYPGSHFHSPFLDNVAGNVIDSIKFGRLTANFFIKLN